MSSPDPASASGTSPAVPTKCVNCQHDMGSPAVCDHCHALNPAASQADYFRLLGMPRRYDLNLQALRQRYLNLHRHAHPDFHTEESADARALSLDVASSLNNAYRTLADPVGRAEYLLQVLGGKGSAEDRSVPEGFLAEVMLLREELEEARAAANQAELQDRRAVLQARLDDMMARLGTMFATFDDAVGCEATRQDELARLRRHLNAISYIRRLLEA